MGIEVSAVHVNKVKNPQRNYPIAIFIVGLMMFLINVLCAMAVAIVVPERKIHMNLGLMAAFTDFFASFHLSWLVPFIALLVAFGAIGTISTWISGPIKGLQVAAQSGDLPPIFQVVNEKGIPINLLILQASLVSVFGVLFVIVPGVTNAYWMLLALTILVYFVMYILLFLAAIRLRYSRPEVHRAYKIPGGKAGMWLVCGVGLLTAMFTMFVCFSPPKQVHVPNTPLYVASMSVGLIIIALIPQIIYQFKKPSWQISKK
jgi:amino acid transporter